MLVCRFIEVRKRAKPRDTPVKRLLLTSITALFLATGAAHAESVMVLLLQDDGASRSGLSDTKTEEDFRRWCSGALLMFVARGSEE